MYVALHSTRLQALPLRGKGAHEGKHPSHRVRTGRRIPHEEEGRQVMVD